MRKVLCLIVCLLSVLPGFAESRRVQVNAPSGVNVREAPSVRGKKIGKLKDKDQAQVLDESSESHQIEGVTGKWLKIQVGTTVGWIFSGNVREVPVANDATEIPQAKAISLIKNHLSKSPHVEFLIKFFSDRSFQIHHIRFPLLTISEDEEGTTEKRLGKKEISETLGIDYSERVGLRIESNQDLSFTLNIYGLECGINIDFLFKPENGSFVLVSVTDHSM